MDKAETKNTSSTAKPLSEQVCFVSWLESTKKKVDAGEGMVLSDRAVLALWHTLNYLKQEIQRMERQ